TGPGHFQSRGNGIPTLTRTIAVVPSQSLHLEIRRFGLLAYMICRCCTVGLPKGMSSRDQCQCFLIVHPHACKGVANVTGGSKWIRISVRPFGIDIDQSHLYRSQWVFQMSTMDIAICKIGRASCRE